MAFSARKAGGKPKERKHSREVHDKAVAIFELLTHFAQEHGVAFEVNQESAEDWKHLHNIAMKVQQAGEVADLACWAWATHKAALAVGRSDFILEQSLTCRGLATEFGKLLEKKRAGFLTGKNGAKSELDSAKSNMQNFLSKQGASRRISLDKLIPDTEDRLRELNASLALVTDPNAKPKEKAEREQLQQQLSELREERRKLSLLPC